MKTKAVVFLMTVAAMVASRSAFAARGDADSSITDKGNNVYEVDATTGWTDEDFSESWTNKFINGTSHTFTFKGAADKGMTLDLSEQELRPVGKWGGYQKAHLVFDGGVHTYGWQPRETINMSDMRFSNQGTRANPVIKVKSGTRLNFFNRTYWGAGDPKAADPGSWIEVESGATLVYTNDIQYAYNYIYDALFYPMILHPGATLQIAHPPSSVANANSMWAADTVIYVPATTNGDERVAKIAVLEGCGQACKILWPRNLYRGFGMDVGENATLEYSGDFRGETQSETVFYPIVKSGRGRLNFKGYQGQYSTHFSFLVDDGILDLTEITGYLYTKIRVETSEGATCIVSATNALCNTYGICGLKNDGVLRITGAGTATLRDCEKIGTIETSDGASYVFTRVVDPNAGRAAYVGEPLEKLTVKNGNKTYPITSCDGTYVYFDYVETLAAGAKAVSGVHSLLVTNGITASVTMTDTDIGGRTMKLDVDGSLTLTAPLKGIIANVTGAGDITLSGAQCLTIASAHGFTGALTVNNGVYTLPKSLEGHVTVGANAFVNYATVSEMASATMRFTVTGYTGAELTNFPILVRVSEATAPGFYTLAASGFRICAADGTELPYDTDVWDTTGESLIWVKVPTLKAGTTLDFCFGLGASGLASSETWRRTNLQPSMTGNTENFAGVWHMSTPDTTAVPDASGNGLTATPDQGTKADSLRRDDGVIGAARQISGQGDTAWRFLAVPYSLYEPMKIATNFTVSTWVRPRKFGVGTETLDKWPRCFANLYDANSGSSGWEIQNSQNANHAIKLFNGTNHSDPAKPIFTGMKLSYDTWTYMTFVFNNKTYRAYTNGVLVSEVTLTRSDAGAPLGNKNASFTMGGRGAEWSLGGDMDEARLYDGVLSADWVAADYATQTKTDFVTAGAATETPVLDTTIEQYGDVALARVALSDVPNTTSTVKVYLITTTGETNETKTATLSAGEVRSFEFSDLSANNIARILVTGTGVTAGSATATLALQAREVYRMLSADKGNSSLVGSSHPNNWSNLVTGTIITTPVAGYDYLLDARETDPVGNVWHVRTDGNGSNADYTFPGNSLTIIGDRTRDLKYQKGGFLASKNYYYTEYSPGLVTFNKLILKNGSFQAAYGNNIHYLKFNVEIPDGYAGFFDLAADNAYNGRWAYLWGTFKGAGTAVFCLWSESTISSSRGYYLHNDWSAFVGKIEINRHRCFYLGTDFVEPADFKELTLDGIALDNLCWTTDGNGRGSWSGPDTKTKGAPSRLIFDGDMTWVATNRGITVRAGGTDNATNVWHFAVKDDATVSLANPLYGEGNLGLNNEMVGYTNGTLRLSASRGEFSGTFSAKGGNLVLAGTKPLGEGTLDLSGAATATIDATELDQPCYLKGFTTTGEKKIVVETPSAYDEDFAFLVTPAEGGVTRANLNLATLPEGIGLRTRVADGLRTFTIGKKLGTLLIIR